MTVPGFPTTGVPTRQGFDEWFGYLNQKNAHSYYPPYLWCNEKKVMLDGNADGSTSDNADKIVTVTGWLEGSDVQVALSELRNAQKTGNTSKADLAALKKKLGRAMNT